MPLRRLALLLLIVALPLQAQADDRARVNALADRFVEEFQRNFPLSYTYSGLPVERNDGLDIHLLWDSASDRVTVALHDAKNGEGFEVEVRPGERALDVFHHPFAYAAFREAASKRAREYAGAT